MKLNRLCLALTGVGMLAFQAGAVGEPKEAPPTSAAAVSPPSSTAGSSFASSPAQQFIQRLAGEWDGQVEVRRDGQVSASVVNISSQLQKDGRAVMSCFEGYAFGKTFDGGSLLGYNPKTQQFESAWFDEAAGSTMRCVASSTDDASMLVFSGQLTSKSGPSMKVEQVLKMTDFTHYTNEWFMVSDSGQKTRFMFLEMTRMAEGQRSAAAQKLHNAAEQARLRNSMANVPQQPTQD